MDIEKDNMPQILPEKEINPMEKQSHKNYRIFEFPWFVLILPAYPVLALWNANYDQIPGNAIWRSLFFSFLFAGSILLFSFLITRNTKKRLLLAALLFVFFYLYGQVFDLIDGRQIAGFVIGRHRYLLPLWFITAFAAAWKLVRSKEPTPAVFRIANLAAAALMVSVGILLAGQYFQTPRQSVNGVVNANQEASAIEPNSGQPDVYYIILDSYGRQDVFTRRYGFDNSGFIAELESLGFVIPACTQSNYTNTVFSVSSSLNMVYISELDAPLLPNAAEINANDFKEYILHSRVREQFEGMGYQFVTFKALYPFIDIKDSDLYIDREKGLPFYSRLESLNFQFLFFRTTALRIVVEGQQAKPELFNTLPGWMLKIINPNADMFNNRTYRQYQENVYALEMLEKMPEVEGAKFVLAHLFTTHQPFVFNPDGSMRLNSKEDDQAYLEQVMYANGRIIEVINSILENSSQPPIIILQGDHGYVRTNDRNQVLNAYYLPGIDPGNVYPSITPVNTFRLIFNEYFGQNFPLLEDQVFFSPRDNPYQLEPMPQSCIP